MHSSPQSLLLEKIINNLPNFSDKKAPKGKSESPWSLHIRSFWKTHFINPPEEQGRVVRRLSYGKENDDVKVSKPPVSVNRKIAQSVPYP